MCAQISKSTAPEHPLFSLSSSLKMRALSPLSAILAIQRRLDSVVAEPSLVDEDSAVGQIPEVDEDSSSALEDEEVNRATTLTVTAEAVAVLEADDDSVGRTTTSRSATAMPLSISSLTGRCWRKLISTAWLS